MLRYVSLPNLITDSAKYIIPFIIKKQVLLCFLLVIIKINIKKQPLIGAVELIKRYQPLLCQLLFSLPLLSLNLRPVVQLKRSHFAKQSYATHGAAPS
jgi:hypothetical protein